MNISFMTQPAQSFAGDYARFPQKCNRNSHVPSDSNEQAMCRYLTPLQCLVWGDAKVRPAEAKILFDTGGLQTKNRKAEGTPDMGARVAHS